MSPASPSFLPPPLTAPGHGNETPRSLLPNTLWCPGQLLRTQANTTCPDSQLRLRHCTGGRLPTVTQPQLARLVWAPGTLARQPVGRPIYVFPKPLLSSSEAIQSSGCLRPEVQSLRVGAGVSRGAQTPRMPPVPRGHLPVTQVEQPRLVRPLTRNPPDPFPLLFRDRSGNDSSSWGPARAWE